MEGGMDTKHTTRRFLHTPNRGSAKSLTLFGPGSDPVGCQSSLQKLSFWVWVKSDSPLINTFLRGNLGRKEEGGRQMGESCEERANSSMVRIRAFQA